MRRAPGVANIRGMDIETIIIGAGQTGLATAYELRRRGRSSLVLDEHARVGDQWRARYASLRLNSAAKYDGLPGMPFPAPKRSFPTGTDMADYLEAYADRMGVDVRGRTGVRAVTRRADGTFGVDTGSGSLVAANVVVATGSEHLPNVPAFADQLDPGIRQMHSTGYRDPSQLLPGSVLVVGAGQSGADLAIESVRAGHETWLAGKIGSQVPFDIESRRGAILFPVIWFVWNHILTMRNPLGRRLQPIIRRNPAPLVRVKRAHLDAAGVHRTDARAVGVTDGRPTLDDGTVLDVRNVIWCTGFRRDWSFIDPPVTGSTGWPTDDRGIVRDVPGLYFVGLLYQSGFYSMLIGGAGRDAAHIADHIARRPAVAAPREAAMATG
jgi:putative flavoprotein involved in K+ transport